MLIIQDSQANISYGSASQSKKNLQLKGIEPMFIRGLPKIEKSFNLTLH